MYCRHGVGQFSDCLLNRTITRWNIAWNMWNTCKMWFLNTFLERRKKITDDWKTGITDDKIPLAFFGWTIPFFYAVILYTVYTIYCRYLCLNDINYEFTFSPLMFLFLPIKNLYALKS